MSADQFVENVVVKRDTLPCACAFYVLAEIDLRVSRSTHGIIADSPHDVSELLLLPSPVAGIREHSNFFDEILEAVDFDGGSPADCFQSRNYSLDRNPVETVYCIGFEIGLAP
jgi:hypothetical protein